MIGIAKMFVMSVFLVPLLVILISNVGLFHMVRKSSALLRHSR